MKYNIWYIEDDKLFHKQFLDFLETFNLLDKVNVENFDRLPILENSPDMIILDIGCIGSCMFDNWDNLYRKLLKFVEAHPNSILILISAVEAWAEDYIIELKKDLEDKITIEQTIKGMNYYESLMEIIKKHIN